MAATGEKYKSEHSDSDVSDNDTQGDGSGAEEEPMSEAEAEWVEEEVTEGKRSSGTGRFVDKSKPLVHWAGGEAAATGLSIALVAAGAPTVIAPVLAVIVLAGHVVVRGVIYIVKKQLQVRVDQQAHLEELDLTEVRADGHFTVVISGIDENGQFNAFVLPTGDASYIPISAGHLSGISKLISGSTRCNVRDMGGFTQDVPAPFSVRISMPDLLALMRLSWVYERFCQTKCGSMTVIVLRSQNDKTKLRVAWENSGSFDNTKATVYTVNEWKKTPYAGKTKTMPTGIADVDMALDKTLVFE